MVKQNIILIRPHSVTIRRLHCRIILLRFRTTWNSILLILTARTSSVALSENPSAMIVPWSFPHRPYVRMECQHRLKIVKSTAKLSDCWASSPPSVPMKSMLKWENCFQHQPMSSLTTRQRTRLSRTFCESSASLFRNIWRRRGDRRRTLWHDVDNPFGGHELWWEPFGGYFVEDSSGSSHEPILGPEKTSEFVQVRNGSLEPPKRPVL